MFAPFENPTAITFCAAKPFCCAAAATKSASLAGPAAEIVDVEDAFRETPEKARHAPLEHIPPRTQHAGRRRKVRRDRQQVVLVAAGSVQQPAVSARRARREQEHVNV